MMSTPPADHNSSGDTPASPGDGGTNPVWLLVGAGALFFGFAAAFLASG
jgi:hypothetical protein